MGTKGQMGVKGGLRGSEELAQIQLDPTGRTFFLLLKNSRNNSGAGLGWGLIG